MYFTRSSLSGFANPFALQSPFLLFYNIINGMRYYQVDHQGCVTRDIFEATRYEINRYENEVRFLGTPLSRPTYVTMPVCAYLPGTGPEIEYYAGNQRITYDPACGYSVFHQGICGAKKLARPLFRLGGPCGAVVQIGTDDERGYTIAYFGIDLIFYPQKDARIPQSLKGFTRTAYNHFVSIPGFW